MILLIAETPVAGTVNRLEHWITLLSGCVCRSLILRNYGNNAFRLKGGAFGCLPDPESYLFDCVRAAELLIVHNVCDETLMDIIFSAKRRSTPVVYQYHSPPNEPPQYGYDIINNYSFDAIFAVAQGYGRFVKEALLVPNIISDLPTAPVAIAKSNIIFSPHLRSTDYRWSRKFSESDKQTLLAVSGCLSGFTVQDIETVFGRKAVTHEEVLFFLKSVSFVVDDLNTGLIHQTTLEAIKAGSIVLSAADLLSVEEFCLATQAPPPPLIYVHGIDEAIVQLILLTRDRNLRRLIDQSEAYAKRYLAESRLAKRYLDILRPYIVST